MPLSPTRHGSAVTDNRAWRVNSCRCDGPCGHRRMTLSSPSVSDVDAVDGGASTASTSDAQCSYGRSTLGGAAGGVGDLGGASDAFPLDEPGRPAVRVAAPRVCGSGDGLLP